LRHHGCVFAKYSYWSGYDLGARVVVGMWPFQEDDSTELMTSAVTDSERRKAVGRWRLHPFRIGSAKIRPSGARVETALVEMFNVEYCICLN